jgi:hypothetical protein
MSELSMSDEILLAILAATDAVFIPDRDPLAHRRHAVIYERRQAFRHSGVPWASERVVPGLDDTGRKQVQRMLDDLALAGLVLTFQPKGAKTLGVRLSDTGDARARTLAGLPAVCDAVAMLGILANLERTDAACAFLGRTWLPETALAGVRWGDNSQRQAFVRIEEQLLPALVRGWAESNCSVLGHCWYAITDAGRKQLRKPVPPASDMPSANDLARRGYYYRVEQELHALASAKPECEREIGEVPMPVCPVPAREEIAK